MRRHQLKKEGGKFLTVKSFYFMPHNVFGLMVVSKILIFLKLFTFFPAANLADLSSKNFRE
jgi:hypothetical protein